MKWGKIISIIVIAIIAAVTVAVVVVRKSHEKVVAKVELKINYDESDYGYDCVSERLQALAAGLEESIIGKSFSDTTLYAVKRQFEGLSYVKSCYCYPYAEDVFRIDITARKAFIKIVHKNQPDAALYVDDCGVVMDLSECRIPQNLDFVELCGNFPKGDEEWMAQIVSLTLKALAISSDATLKTIEALSPTDLVLHFETTSKDMAALTVRFGDIVDKEKKLSRLETFFTTIFPTTEKKYKTIDLRYNKQIICK